MFLLIFFMSCFLTTVCSDLPRGHNPRLIHRNAVTQNARIAPVAYHVVPQGNSHTASQTETQPYEDDQLVPRQSLESQRSNTDKLSEQEVPSPQ